MKKKLNTRVISFFMSFAMLFQVLPITVFAAMNPPTIVSVGGIDVDQETNMGGAPTVIIGEEYSAQVDAEGADLTYTAGAGGYMALPAGLTINSETGLISGTCTAEIGRYDVYIEVSNAAGAAHAVVGFTVGDSSLAPTIKTEAGSIGTAYKDTSGMFKVSMNNENAQASDVYGFEWSLVSGSLPTGMNLTYTKMPDVYISGTPTEIGTFNFELKAQNDFGSETKSFSINVIEGDVRPDIIVPANQQIGDTIIGQAFEYQFEATGTNTLENPILWSIDDDFNKDSYELGKGLSISKTGLISGTPTEAGTVSFTVYAKNSEGKDNQYAYINIHENGEVTSISITPEVVVLERGASQEFTVSLEGYGTVEQVAYWTGSYNDGSSWIHPTASNLDVNSLTPSKNVTLTVGAEEEKDEFKISAYSMSGNNGVRALATIYVVDKENDYKFITQPQSATLEYNEDYVGTWSLNFEPTSVNIERYLDTEPPTWQYMNGATATGGTISSYDFNVSNKYRVVAYIDGEAIYSDEFTVDWTNIQPITEINVTTSGYEVDGNIASSEITTTTEGVTIASYEWQDNEGNKLESGSFEANTQYRLQVYLNINDGYKADELVKTNVKIDGTETTYFTNPCNGVEAEKGDMKIYHYPSQLPEEYSITLIAYDKTNLTPGTGGTLYLDTDKASVNGMNIVKSATENTEVTINAEASEGYEFVEWKKVSFEGDTYTTNANHKFSATEDIWLYAIFQEKPTYTVTFESNGGTEVDSQVLQVGEKATKPENPVKEDRTFFAWYKDEELTETFDFVNETITGDITLYAGWTVYVYAHTYNATTDETNTNTAGIFKLNAQEAELVNQAIGILEGTELTLTAIPKEGYRFVEWRSGTTDGTVVSTNEAYTFDASNMTLYAVFEEETYTVTFNSNGGSSVTPQIIRVGEKATKPENPVKEDRTFFAWYKNEELTETFDFVNETITGDITLYAGWTVYVYAHTYNATTDETNTNTAGIFKLNAQEAELVNQAIGILEGTELTLTAIPKEGYRFVEWRSGTTDGTVVSTNEAYTFDASNMTLYAVFEEETYITTVNNGTATPATAVVAGTEVTITANEPETGKEFDKWTVVSGGITLVDETSATTTFTMGTSDVVVTATYKDIQYWIAAFTTTGDTTQGTVQINSGSKGSSRGQNFAYNTNVTLTAEAAEGFQFVRWDIKYSPSAGVSATNSNNPTTVNAVQDYYYYAVFEADTSTKYTTTVNSGTATPTQAAEGVTVTITAAEPESGKEFDKWTVVSGGITLADETSATTTFTMGTSDVVVTATYKNIQYWIGAYTTTGDTTQGTVQINSGFIGASTGQNFAYNTNVTLTAEAAEGFRFVRWDIKYSPSAGVSATNSNNPTTVNALQDYYYYAVFEADPSTTYTTTVNNGTVAPTTSVVVGTEVTITANEPETGKEFDKWTVVSGGITLADETSATTTFTMGTANVEVTANYKDVVPVSYTTTVNNGTVAPTTSVVAGTEVTITANEPETGKEFDKWTVVSGGITLADETSATTTFTMGTANVEVTANYKDVVPVSYTTTVNNGTVTPTTAVVAGTEVTITANEPETGKEFDKWTVVSGGITLADETASETTFTMGTSDVVVTATYKNSLPTYIVTFNSNGGSAVAAIENVTSGSTIAKPTNPTKSGYTFVNWYKEAELTNEFNFAADTITENTTLFAKWNKKQTTGGGGGSTTTKYTITVKQNDNGTISPETTKVEKGDNQKFEIKADKGYEVEKVLVDGKSVGEITEYTFEKVKEKHTIEATFKKVEEVTEETWKNPFTDVDEDDWYYESVKFANENKLFNGVSNTEFGPNVSMTRAMLVTVLYRLEGEPATNKSIPFADVDMSSYYASAVIWAKQNNIVNGIDDTNFAPNGEITREQLATILYRYANYKGIDVSVGENTNILSYDDFSELSEYAIPAMQWACGSGIITGRTISTIAPKGTATRAEVATMLMRFTK